MQTALDKNYRDTEQGLEAEAILRTCVHCGFCNATCPTYQLLGDELDGPRGRIYLIKQVLEGQPVSEKTQQHLDRCLTCLACETTCPSGVRYGHLIDIGRQIVESAVPRSALDQVKRRALRMLVPYPQRFSRLVSAGQTLQPLLPSVLRQHVPRWHRAERWPSSNHSRKMLLLDGCVQPVMAPNINLAAAQVFDRAAVSLVRVKGAGCCGAVSQHLGAEEEARVFMRRNIDAWWPHIEAGAEAIVMTASGCGSVVKEYGYYLRNDQAYAEKAARIAELTRDISEVAVQLGLARFCQGQKNQPLPRVAFQAPCSLQHGQKITGVIEGILQEAGYTLTQVPDAHLCCGSAGTYSLLQPQLSQQLLTNKLLALQNEAPDIIATANIGCLNHLASKAQVPVVHWIELLAK
jgi:glycolate oxidase iron-sulfur subunit